MTLRSGHGQGSGTPRIEVLAPDELPSASPSFPVRRDRDASGRFVAGNTAGQAKRLRPGLRGEVAPVRTEPRYRAFARWGRRYANQRRRELAALHGGTLSVGVGALLDSAAHALGASRFLQSLGAESCDVELFKQATALAVTARQHELAAWELAAREAQCRPRPSVQDLLAKFRSPPDGEQGG